MSASASASGASAGEQSRRRGRVQIGVQSVGDGERTGSILSTMRFEHPVEKSDLDKRAQAWVLRSAKECKLPTSYMGCTGR